MDICEKNIFMVIKRCFNNFEQVLYEKHKEC